MRLSMAIQKNKAGKQVKTRTKLWLRLSAIPRTKTEKAADREQREKELLGFANLIPGRSDPPDFPPTNRPFEEAPAETAAFQRFLDMHFPRRKFAALREVLDQASRSKVTTPIKLYRAIFESRQLLRSASRTMNFICAQAGLRRPPLQICEEGCGKLFVANRPDQLTCSERCSARRRVTRARAEKRLHDDIRKSMAEAGPAAVARALKFEWEERGVKK